MTTHTLAHTATPTPTAHNPFGALQRRAADKPATAAPTTTAPNAKAPAITADITGSVLTLTFSNGQTLELDAAKLHTDMQHAAMLHGLKQKLVDAAAIGRDVETGRSATITDKFEAVKEIYDRLTGDAPTWNKVREGGTGGGSGGLLARALMELSGKDRTTVDAQLAVWTKEQKLALRKNDRIAAIITRMQSEGADNSIDTDGLLDELL